MLKHMRIGKRLIIAFIAVALIVSISGFVGFVLMSNLDANYSIALVENGFVQGDIGDFNTYLQKGAAMTRDVIMLTDQADIAKAQADLDAATAKTVEAYALAKEYCKTPAELEILAKIDEASPKYSEMRDKAVALGLQNKNDEALRVFREEAMPYLTACVTAGEELMELNVAMGTKVSDKLTAQSKFGMITIIAVIAAGLIVSIFLAIYISRGISKPMSEIEHAAKEMAKGNYDVEVKFNARDEVGSLAECMRQMMSITKAIVVDLSRGLNEIADGNFNIHPQTEYIGVFKGAEDAMGKIISDLSHTMSQIKMSAEQVSGGSEQVASGSQALAQGATEQASSVQELSASINEIAEQIKQNAGNAETASNVVQNVGGAIDTSNQQMIQMTSAMSDISKSSQEIGKIIKTIEDIAFQTNILALNAAVEAARAGAAGKGFAVVADEVRNLATKSSEAAKQTNVLIEESVKSVDSGVKIANETATSLSEVVSGAQEVIDLIGKISRASVEQSQSIAQINVGVEQISSVVQTNSATSEESAAASEELNGQANMMKSMVSKFRLKDGTVEEINLF